MIVWASGTCPWLHKSAMSYTPTYRTPWVEADRRRTHRAPLLPAGSVCVQRARSKTSNRKREKEKREDRKREKGTVEASRVKPEKEHSHDGSRMILTRRAAWEKERICFFELRPSDPVFFPSKVLVEYLLSRTNHPRNQSNDATQPSRFSWIVRLKHCSLFPLTDRAIVFQRTELYATRSCCWRW